MTMFWRFVDVLYAAIWIWAAATGMSPIAQWCAAIILVTHFLDRAFREE